MTTTVVPDVRARSVRFTDESLVVELHDGRALTVPLAWLPRIATASPEQRARCVVVGDGRGLDWPELGEDVSIAWLLRNGAEDEPPPRRGRGYTLDELRARRAEILAVAATFGASEVRVFGSVVRGQATTGSDVDLLVVLEPGRSLLDLSGLIIDLQELLGCRVDAATPDMLKDAIRARVLQEAVAL